MKKIQAIFLDRDGTIGGSTIVTLPKEFKLYDNAKEAIDLIKSHKKLLFSFTNQPDISRGYCSKQEFEQELLSFGFNKPYICPHTHKEGCKCRKPGTLMLENAAQEYKLDLTRCVVIGDRWSDMLAAAKAGCIMILVKTGAGNDALTKYRHKWQDYTPNYVADDVLDAVNWLINRGYM